MRDLIDSDLIVLMISTALYYTLMSLNFCIWP